MTYTRRLGRSEFQCWNYVKPEKETEFPEDDNNENLGEQDYVEEHKFKSGNKYSGQVQNGKRHG